MFPRRRKIRVSNHRNALAYEPRQSLLEKLESLNSPIIPSSGEWLAGSAFLSKTQSNRGTSLGSQTPSPSDDTSSQESFSVATSEGVAIRDFAYGGRGGNVVPVEIMQYVFVDEEEENGKEWEGGRRASAPSVGGWGDFEGCGEVKKEEMEVVEDMFLRLPVRGRKGLGGGKVEERRPMLTRSDDTMRKSY